MALEDFDRVLERRRVLEVLRHVPLDEHHLRPRLRPERAHPAPAVGERRRHERYGDSAGNQDPRRRLPGLRIDPRGSHSRFALRIRMISARQPFTSAIRNVMP